MGSSSYFLVAGCTAPLFALFIVWCMLNPDSRLMFFFLFPVKTKWLLAGILGASFLIAISQGDFITLALVIMGTVYGYLTGTMGYGLNSPYSITGRLDRVVIDLGERLRYKWKNNHTSESKIIDFETGKPLNKDDEFVDAMLAKISESGEKSLTSKERKRLNKIAEDKQKPK